MRIVYVAKHGSGGNDDEGAIAHALSKLGHTVIPVQESAGESATKIVDADFCLFHKWDDFASIGRLKVPAVFWYFDLVEYNDTTLNRRNEDRRRWMRRAIDFTLAQFCTDGDWAEKKGLCHLPQGADERLVGMEAVGPPSRVLMTASQRGGQGRDSFFQFVTRKVRNLVWHKSGLHGADLRKAVAASAAVIAPQHPCTDRYWSNRVYLILGFGGILLHPATVGLADHFTHEHDILYYSSHKDFLEKLEYAQNLTDEQSMRMRVNAIDTIQTAHLYRHRCEKLVELVKERL